MAVVVGLTGGIATGKTTVAKMFHELGASYIDTDQVAREALSPGSDAVREVLAAFGPETLNEDGSVNRRKLADIVFADAEAREKLNRIVHPRVTQRLKPQIDRFRAQAGGGDVLVVEIPLLVEAKLQCLVDKVVVVAAEQETQMNRLKMRSSLSYRQISQRMESQLPIREKVRFADWVVTTDCEMAETRSQVERIWRELQEGGRTRGAV